MFFKKRDSVNPTMRFSFHTLTGLELKSIQASGLSGNRSTWLPQKTKPNAGARDAD